MFNRLLTYLAVSVDISGRVGEYRRSTQHFLELWKSKTSVSIGLETLKPTHPDLVVSGNEGIGREVSITRKVCYVYSKASMRVCGVGDW